MSLSDLSIKRGQFGNLPHRDAGRIRPIPTRKASRLKPGPGSGGIGVGASLKPGPGKPAVPLVQICQGVGSPTHQQPWLALNKLAIILIPKGCGGAGRPFGQVGGCPKINFQGDDLNRCCSLSHGAVPHLSPVSDGMFLWCFL